MKLRESNLINSVIAVLLIIFSCSFTGNKPVANNNPANEKPKIVNIINFIRLLEPRDKAITEDVLYRTVVKQLETMKQYNLGGTFLLQYDALMDNRYQELLKNLPKEYEIGAWWEIPQQLVEKAGLKWRGRYSWDWHANVGFSIGYSLAEREKLVDAYMKDFKQIFGYYPKSVGSWFIDEHSLEYMQSKYGVKASCCCKDQIGTDGYTLWGGYWNQAYYPSKNNFYMPAQNEKNQIPVPVFRMLGSDPVRQYDDGLSKGVQGVATLEPAYDHDGGSDSAWVNWYIKEFLNGPSINFAYVQAGQENSFTWQKFSVGFELQMKLYAQLRQQNKIRVQTLAETGEWFRENYKITPATSVTALSDLKNDSLKTVWYDSRFYRANILWENGRLRFRDIHLFDEKLKSDYYNEKCTTSNCSYFTLPFIDGHQWSSEAKRAGLRIKAVIGGKETELEGGQPKIAESGNDKLHIVWPLKNIEGNFIVNFNEREISMKLESREPVRWFTDFTTAENKTLPFVNIGRDKIVCKYKNLPYHAKLSAGSVSVPGRNIIFRISPANGQINLNLAER